LVKLVVGLGNPGGKYDRTRHNLGFLVVDRIAAQSKITVKKKVCDSLMAEWSIAGERVLLAKPQTYMNRSGDAVKRLLRKFHASPEELVVVYDDLDLPFGRIRIRPKGGAGGHRGLLSIIESVGGAPFYRLRMGIGRPPNGMNAEDYVLEPFDSAEIPQLDEFVARGAEALCTLLSDGGHRAMERFNRAS
jgi:peptidyl-tRNA hydrolase, PTH1 family